MVMTHRLVLEGTLLALVACASSNPSDQAASAINGRAGFVHPPLRHLKRLLLVVQGTGQLFASRRCCAVASADSRLSAWATRRALARALPGHAAASGISRWSSAGVGKTAA